MRPVAAPLGLLFCLTVAAPGFASSPSVFIQQSSTRNIASVIQERSSVLSIHRNRSVTDGSTTVDEVVAIGPDIVPVIISQHGTANRAITYQQGTAPSLDLRQVGTFNTSRAIQREIP